MVENGCEYLYCAHSGLTALAKFDIISFYIGKIVIKTIDHLKLTGE